MSKAPILGAVLTIAMALGSPAVGRTGANPANTGARPSCTVRILFLGNSYTYFNDLPAVVSELAKAGGQCAVETRMIAPGGAQLKDHWGAAETHATLRAEKWDYVVLQDQSSLGVGYYLDGNPRVASDALFLPYARKWAKEIRQLGAQPVFYLTWSRKATPDDQAALNYAYIHAAKETGGLVAPVGIAWRQVRERNPALELYYKDGTHPSPGGTYLAACAIYATIFRRDPSGLPPHIVGVPVNLETEKPEPDKTAVLIDLPASDAAILQRAAWRSWTAQTRSDHRSLRPVSPPKPIVAPGQPLSPASLDGTWRGQLLFYPGVGPVEVVLKLQRADTAWRGRLDIDYPPNTFAAESFDLGDLQVGQREITFSDPKSAGVNNWRIDFRGSLNGSELKGIATTVSERKDEPPIVVLGDWSLRRDGVAHP